jgi:hypothetical protein
MKATTVKEVLVASKWILENYDWCQWFLWRDTDGFSVYFIESITSGNTKLGACCLSGAVSLVEKQHYSLKQKTFDLIHKAIDGELIPNWNDDPKRTKQEVIALLDKLIGEQL